MITNVNSIGAIGLKDHKKIRFTVNGQRMKHYHVGGPVVDKVYFLYCKGAY